MFSWLVSSLRGAPTDYERERIARSARSMELMQRNIQAHQMDAAKFAAEHNCSIVITDPDGTMRPG